MASDPQLVEVLQALASKNADEILAMTTDMQRNPWLAVFTGFMMGAQWALELAQLDDEIARRLIEVIHGTLQPETAPEWNQNAMEYIKLVRGQA